MKKNTNTMTCPAHNENLPAVQDTELNYYFKRIKNIPVLSQSEQHELVKRAQNGDLSAKKKLIRSNLKLVVNIAKKTIFSSHVPMIDLIQEGNLGLMVAVDKFNCKYGYKFSTYAAWWIKQAMFKAISEQSFNIKIPVYIQETLSKYSKVKNQLEKKYNCEVKVEDVAKEMNISSEKIEKFLAAYNSSISLDAEKNLPSGKSVKIIDIIEDESQSIDEKIENNELQDEINEIISKLKDREQKVIQWRFGINNLQQKTLGEIGKLFGVTKECIRQTELRALKKMKTIINAENLYIGYCYN